jgi:hypothetical protein
VAPADADGPDGRHWVELELEPGEEVTERVAVTNLSDRQVTFSLVAADGYFTATGRFNMLNNPEESVDAGTWIAIEPRVSVEPNETAVVPFTVAVPADAEPGDHAAGVAAAVTSAAGESGSGLGVTSRFGFRVMTRVAGEIRPGLEIQGLSGRYDVAWSPAKPGRLHVTFDLVNTGNVRLIVTGAVDAGGGNTAFPADKAPQIELLPGAQHSVETTVDGVWPLVSAKVAVTALPAAVVLGETEATELDAVAAQARVWTPPWPQLVCLAGLALILAAILGGRSRSRKRIALMLEAARAEERARAAASPSVSFEYPSQEDLR